MHVRSEIPGIPSCVLKKKKQGPRKAGVEVKLEEMQVVEEEEAEELQGQTNPDGDKVEADGSSSPVFGNSTLWDLCLDNCKDEAEEKSKQFADKQAALKKVMLEQMQQIVRLCIQATACMSRSLPTPVDSLTSDLRTKMDISKKSSSLSSPVDSLASDLRSKMDISKKSSSSAMGLYKKRTIKKAIHQPLFSLKNYDWKPKDFDVRMRRLTREAIENLENEVAALDKKDEP